MRVIRWGAVAVGALATVAVAGPAAAQVNPPQMQEPPELAVLADHDGLTVLQAPCEAGGQITVTATDISYHVSSGVRTAGLAAQLGDQQVAQLQEPADAGEHLADELITLEAPAEGGTLEYRWFAGPDRTDLPAWTATGPADAGWADVVAAIVELEELEERHWDARDTGPFVTWHEVDVTGCPAASPSPEATVTATPTPGASEGPAPGAAGEQLPVTGSPVGLFVGLGLGAMLAGAGLIGLARRRRTVG